MMPAGCQMADAADAIDLIFILFTFHYLFTIALLLPELMLADADDAAADITLKLPMMHAAIYDITLPPLTLMILRHYASLYRHS